MDPTRTATALKYGSDRGGSGILVRAGQRVGTWGSQTTNHVQRSSTKSFGSVLLGLALKDVKLGLDTAVQPILPELGVPQSTAKATAWLSKIIVRHLATHTSGFDKPGGIEPVLYQPGTGWFYSDGAANWFADLLTVSYMLDRGTLMRSRVLKPMGIAYDKLVWRTNANRPHTLRGVERREFGSGISTRVDVMARFGLMLLRDGRWKTAQILPAATYPDLAGRPADGLSGLPCLDPDPKKCPGAPKQYGILFWTNGDGHFPDMPHDAYWAVGQGTSFILVIPSLDIVVARTGPKWTGPGNVHLTDPFFTLVSEAVNQ
jgi:CubicO group peptidase (beta-lactamase class C family)